MNYKFVKISNYYSSYLEYFYKKNTNIPKDYNDHLTLILNDSFSYGNAWSKYLGELGNRTYEIIYNDEKLQKKWAYLNGIVIKKDWKNYILYKQLEKIKPDVVFWNCRIVDENKFIKHIKELIPTIKVHFTQEGSIIRDINYYQEYDFVITCVKDYIGRFASKGIDTYFVKHGFHLDILNKIELNRKNIIFSFFGSINSGFLGHNERADYIEWLIKKSPLEFWSSFKNPTFIDHSKEIAKRIIGVNVNILKNVGINDSFLLEKLKYNRIESWEIGKKLLKYKNNIIRKIRKPVFGLDMFQKLSDSKISFNIHGDLAKNHAGNVRMYEVTGVGTCLLTDWKEDISEYFEPDYEIVTYKSKEEVLEKVKYLLNNPGERERIALNGQKRTLRDHTLKKRVEKVNEIILKYL